MKIVHRKTLWVHSLFSIVMLVILAIVWFVRQDFSTLLLTSFLALYITGNAYIHLKRDDFKKETLYEYLLLGLAVFIVLSSLYI